VFLEILVVGQKKNTVDSSKDFISSGKTGRKSKIMLDQELVHKFDLMPKSSSINRKESTIRKTDY